jgi:hypothetical protein
MRSDVVVGSVDHPQSGVLDFYREFADLFGITMPLHNRWAGFKAHREHPTWTFKLHHDNLVALAKSRPELLPLPSYPTLRRWMQSDGLLRKRRKRREHEGAGFVPREQRSFEVSHVHALWHLDFHQCSRSVLLPSGEWKKPVLLGVLDDCSRLCCHLQWFLGCCLWLLLPCFRFLGLGRRLPSILGSNVGSGWGATAPPSRKKTDCVPVGSVAPIGVPAKAA